MDNLYSSDSESADAVDAVDGSFLFPVHRYSVDIFFFFFFFFFLLSGHVGVWGSTLR